MTKALITAGLGGLGSALVKEFQNKDIECIVTTSSPEKVSHDVLLWNMQESGSSKSLWSQIKNEEIKYFIHCAHIFSPAQLAPNIKAQDFSQNLLDNTAELFVLLNYLCRKFNRKKIGSINIIGSLVALNPAPGKVQYITEKMAIQGLVSALRAEYKNLDFHIFHPGLINTAQVQARIADHIKDQIQKLLDPHEVAKIIVSDILNQEEKFIIPISGEQSW